MNKFLIRLSVFSSLFLVACDGSTKTSYEVIGDEVIYHYVVRHGGFFGGSNSPQQRKVEGADASSFRTLQYKYARDDKAIYYEGRFVRRDPETFKILSSIYTLDRSHVYIRNKQMPKSYPASFRILSQGYSKDRKQVYHEDGFIVKGADADTFEVLNNSYGRDLQNVYRNGNLVKGVSSKYVKILNYDYILDDKAVYYRGKVLTKAKPEKFRQLSYNYYTDDKTVWFDGKKINADAKTFRVLNRETRPDSTNYTAEDKYSYFQNRTVIKKQ